jgi:diphthamide synthase (EF-2-diphthine--ammonia ligase)
MEEILVSWSGGKDSALALHEVLKESGVEVLALVTTVTAEYERISMHDVRSSLLEKHADALSLKPDQVTISKDASSAEYESITANLNSTL